jgi:NodT family efflux transporter outer membrane factor (OMF) lipoprotein
MRARISLVCLAALLGACSVGPDYTPPKPLEIGQWHDAMLHPVAAVTQASNPDPHWWNSFNDPVLTTLIEKAVAGNLDLRQAVLRVAESRQNEVSARAAGIPTVGGNGSYVRDQLGLRGLLLSQGASSAFSSPAVNGVLGSIGQPVNLFQYGLSSSWELDLFGRVRRSEEQAEANTQGQAEALNDALVMLESQVVQAYVQLRGAQVLTQTQQENVRTARSAFDLTSKREQQGLATDLDAEQARSQLATTESQLPAYEKQSEQAMNRLSVLSGQPPGALDEILGSSAPLPSVPPVVGLGVPSTLARRRPDIRQAEARLHAVTANVGVAVASFYPDLSLTGGFGLRAVDGSYLTNWASAFYSFGPSVSLPIFQGGRLTANLRLAKDQEAEAAINYRSTVLNALREVEDAIVAYRTDRAARDKIDVAVRSGQTALFLARDRYTHGIADFIQVLDAERTLIGARQQLVQADVALTNDVVALYTALGGGWEDGAGAVTAAVPAAVPPVVPAAIDSLAAALPR